MAGGVFRLVVPDLEMLVRNYLDSDQPTRAITFMQKSYLGKESRPKKAIPILREFIGNSHHLWMWDFDLLELELRNAGFQSIRKATFGDSN